MPLSEIPGKVRKCDKIWGVFSLYNEAVDDDADTDCVLSNNNNGDDDTCSCIEHLCR